MRKERSARGDGKKPCRLESVNSERWDLLDLWVELSSPPRPPFPITPRASLLSQDRRLGTSQRVIDAKCVWHVFHRQRSSLMNGKRREIPVTPPERELQ